MPSRDIMHRLNSGERILLDGGMGSELQRRGADVLKGASVERGLEAWSATANIEFADVVQQVHQDYARVGADIHLSNNFWTNRPRLEPIGLGDRWQEYARAAGENAVRGRDAVNPESYVAGTPASPWLQRRMDSNEPDSVLVGRETYRSESSEQAQILADVGVDLMFPEFVGHVADAIEMVDACAETGLPVFLSIRHLNADGTMPSGETFHQLAEALEGHKVDAITIMCTRPEYISVGLPILRDAFDGHVGAYPNIGINPMAPIDSRRGKDFLTNDDFEAENYVPSRLAEFAQTWKDMGATIIGGCCATGPEHIMAMRDVVKDD